ncbi:unnamed protein product [Vitrella brassicaformis CCMP3155]|uniref:EamA domain-containing protein n=1 Tax=Vitrella brassicaformis (strain CCMP3155) TaxID=1169540 RepID=A0A0G4GMZ1_VITBC|nr:unnamed protein product [Vitrella brassicaformis CCMP3155]|mmetsp:Transcript_34774/g.86262  ORF Transcript_34774/g.86262 Transcript_34774/m.86262 type:complete len:360 (-) Transcript_34774:307-1386(-)|eukprot:CEM31581.1 unnamed protein product [Vitrella brassicaformis CCMP3155]
MAVNVGGLLVGALSAVFNGSFAAVMKFVRVQLDEMVFMTYCCLGVALSSIIALLFLPLNDTIAGAGVGTSLAFTSYGLAAGALLVGAFTFSFLAVAKAGVSIGQGVWCGTAIIVSYLWGTLAFGDVITNVPLNLIGLVLLLVGSTGIAFCQELPRLMAQTFTTSGTTAGSGANEQQMRQEDSNQREPLTRDTDDADRGRPSSPHHSSSKLVGLGVSVLTGVFGGSILVPKHYVPKSADGIAFLPSFAVGVVAFMVLVMGVYVTVITKRRVQWHVQAALLPGLISGCLWNLGNICSIAAIPRLGYSVAYPLLQCALLISGLLGIVVFREVRQPAAVSCFWGSSIVLILGAVLLSLSSHPK